MIALLIIRPKIKFQLFQPEPEKNLWFSSFYSQILKRLIFQLFQLEWTPCITIKYRINLLSTTIRIRKSFHFYFFYRILIQGVHSRILMSPYSLIMSPYSFQVFVKWQNLLRSAKFRIDLPMMDYN